MRYIILAILAVVMANDPNYVAKPIDQLPPPGVQYVSADPNYITITQSVRVPRKKLLREKARLEKRIKALQIQLYHVNTKLAFKE